MSLSTPTGEAIVLVNCIMTISLAEYGSAHRPQTATRFLGRLRYSHSIVPGGLLVTSYTTRLTPFTSFMMRVATWPMNFMSNG